MDAGDAVSGPATPQAQSQSPEVADHPVRIDVSQSPDSAEKELSLIEEEVDGGPRHSDQWHHDGGSSKSRDRTKLAMLLMIFGFAMAWIPYLDILGGILVFLGIIGMWLGRDAFRSSHGTSVMLGGFCILISLLIVLCATIWFVSAVASDSQASGETLSAMGAALQSDVSTFFMAALVAEAFGVLGYVAMPYALADDTSRRLLWIAAILAIAISVAAYVSLSSQIAAALQTATSGTSINLAPIQSLQNESTGWAAVQFFPDMLFLWAYFRTREQVFYGSKPASSAREPSKSMSTEESPLPSQLGSLPLPTSGENAPSSSSHGVSRPPPGT